MGYHWSAYAWVLCVAAAADAVAIARVWHRRGATGATSLCVVLAGAGVWCLAYALELSAPTFAGRQLWGALKYLGTTALPPAWFVFALQYTGRGRTGPRLYAALCVEPLIVLGLLAVPQTRALVRSYPPGPLPAVPVPRLGGAYWVHLVYTNLLVLAASALLLTMLVRSSRPFWRQSVTLLVAIFLPFLSNVMSSLKAAPFGNADPTPLAVSVAAVVVVHGVLRFGLLDLIPVAHTLVLKTLQDAVLVVDAQGRVVELNPAAQKLIGRPAREAVGRPVATLLDAPAAASALADPGVYEVVSQRSGQERHLELTVTPLADVRGTAAGRLLLFRDVSDRARLEQDLRRLAYYDTLTGLPNRALFTDRLERALSRARRHGERLAVFFIDLDRFKVINDSLGHELGDKVLTSVAARMQACLRAEDTLARLGGDEFAVMLAEISDDDSATMVADRLLASLTTPHPVDGHDLTVGASLGVALFPRDGPDVDRLLRSADTAMYRAKARGRGRAEVFVPTLAEQATRRQRLEADLRRGLRAGELELVYQPYRDLPSGAVVGVEALVRWRHPRLGMLDPAAFVPLAEDCGLVEALDSWVLREACEQARRWSAPVTISVNVSPPTLRAGDLLREVPAVLGDVGLRPDRLVLELSERTAFGDEPEALAALATLAESGVGIALDDFGAGHTSLGQLRWLPLTTLKIDRSLIAGLGVPDRGDTALVAAIIQFAHALTLSVTAEGIERRPQLDELLALGCETGQGFLLDRPQAATSVTRALTELRPGEKEAGRQP